MNVEPEKELIVAEEKVTEKNHRGRKTNGRDVGNHAIAGGHPLYEEAIRQAKKRQLLWGMSPSAVSSSIRTRSSVAATTAAWQIRRCWPMRRSLPCGKLARRWATGGWRTATMYVTLEPCPMCAEPLCRPDSQSGHGCMNSKAGCAGSVLDMLHEEGFNHQVQTDINVCQEEVLQNVVPVFLRI